MTWTFFWQLIGLSAWCAFLVIAVGTSFKKPGGPA